MMSTQPEGGECEITIEWLYGAFHDVSEMYVDGRFNLNLECNQLIRGAAFYHRGAGVCLVYCCYFRSNSPQWASWTTSYDGYFLSKCLGVAPNYTNALLPKADLPRLYWGDNYMELQAAKAFYDPENFFDHPNHF